MIELRWYHHLSGNDVTHLQWREREAYGEWTAWFTVPHDFTGQYVKDSTVTESNLKEKLV